MLVGLPSQRLLLPIIGAAAFLAFLGLLSFQQRLSVSAVSAADASFANSPYEQKLNRYRTGESLPAAVPHDALKKVSMTSDECEAAFPGYAKELERLMWLRDEKISSVEIDEAEQEVRKGGVESWARVLVWDGKLYVISSSPTDRQGRLTATLHSLQNALLTSPTRLPAAEFILIADTVAPPHILAWTSSRASVSGPSDRNLAMPDGSVVYAHSTFGSYSSARREIEKVNSKYLEKGPDGPMIDLTKKTQKLLYQARKTGIKDKDDALDTTAKVMGGKEWSDLQIADIHGAALSSSDDPYSHVAATAKPPPPAAPACNNAYLLHIPFLATPATTATLPVHLLMHCNSVVISPDLQSGRITHYSHMFSHEFYASYQHQNYIRVRSDLSDLEEQMQWVLDYPVEAQKIADRARQTVERFLSDAAVACTWRRGVEVWGGLIMDGEEEKGGERREWGAVPKEKGDHKGKGLEEVVEIKETGVAGEPQVVKTEKRLRGVEFEQWVVSKEAAKVVADEMGEPTFAA